MRLRRLACLAMIAAAAAVLSASVAGAQSDAQLGCEYRIAPIAAGPVSFENPLELIVEQCAQPWRSFEVAIAEGGTASVVTEVSDGFTCTEAGVECQRDAPSGAAASALFQTQCPEGKPISATLSLIGSATRTGAAKTFPCARPPMRVLSAPRSQSLGAALRRGVVAKYSCSVTCRAEVDLIVPTSKGQGLSIGTKRVGARRGGPLTVRVKPNRAERGRLRGKRRVTAAVAVVLRAASGEELEGSKDVTLRR